MKFINGRQVRLPAVMCLEKTEKTEKPPVSSLDWERHRVDEPNSIARYIRFCWPTGGKTGK